MRICLIANPQATHTQRWATALGDRGHDVHVIGVRNAAFENATVHCLSPRDPQSTLAVAIAYVRLGLRLRFLVNAIDPNVVLAHYTTTNGVLARLARLRPLVVFPWGTDIREEPDHWKRRLRETVNRWVLRRTEDIVVSSRYLRERVLTVTSGRCSPPVVIPFGVDPTAFTPTTRAPDSPEFRIGFIKHLRRRYGAGTLIDAMPLVLAEVPTARLVMAGAGPLEATLKQQAAKLGIADRVDFIGRIPHSDVPDLMATLDVLVNPSLEESFGVVLLEAGSTGLPAITSDVGGVREIIEDGVTGLLVPPDEATALSDAIIRLGLDSSLRRELGAAARRRVVDTFDWSSNVAELDALLTTTVRRSVGARFASVRAVASRMESIPEVNRILRPALVRSWDAVWGLAIRLRVRRGGSVQELDLDVGKLAINLNDRGVAWPLIRYREYEAPERLTMSRLLQPGMHAIDIGAHVGYHTLLLSRLVGETGRVVAIEAAPENYTLLRRNLGSNRATNVTALNVAASDQEGEALLEVDHRNLGAHHLVSERHDGETVAVTAQRIDEVAGDLDLRPDFLKMDIEGAEVAAIRGMSTILAAPDLALLTELNRPALQRAGSSPDALLAALERYGFAFFQIEGNGEVRRSSSDALLRATAHRANVNFVAAKGAALVRISDAAAR